MTRLRAAENLPASFLRRYTLDRGVSWEEVIPVMLFVELEMELLIGIIRRPSCWRIIESPYLLATMGEEIIG